MTENLRLSLIDDNGDPKTVIASDNSGNTFDYTPETCESNKFCALNGNTTYDNALNQQYYNWYASTAGRGTPDTPSQTIIDGSICPVGWKLSTGSVGQKSIGNLWYVYTLVDQNISGESAISPIQIVEDVPLDFIAVGRYYMEVNLYINKLGDYMSSKSQDMTSEYRWVVTSSYNPVDYVFTPKSRDYGVIGSLVRCVNI